MKFYVALCMFFTILPAISGVKTTLWITAMGDASDLYFHYLRAAVMSVSALKSQSLYPVLILMPEKKQGERGHLPRWLLSMNASRELLIVPHQLSFADTLSSFGKEVRHDLFVLFV